MRTKIVFRIFQEHKRVLTFKNSPDFQVGLFFRQRKFSFGLMKWKKKIEQEETIIPNSAIQRGKNDAPYAKTPIKGSIVQRSSGTAKFSLIV